MGQNGTITSALDGTYPAQEYGEAVGAADFVGIRDDAGDRKVLFKAFAGVTAGLNVQCPALAVNFSDQAKYKKDAVRPNTWRINFPYPLPTDLEGIEPGDPVYLSNTVPGAVQKDAPSTVDELVQILGYAYWHGARDTGINTDENATGMLVDIQPATIVSA